MSTSIPWYYYPIAVFILIGIVQWWLGTDPVNKKK